MSTNRPLLPVCLAAVLLVGVLTGRSAAAQGARVDLNLFYQVPVVPAGVTDTQTFTVTNSGVPEVIRCVVPPLAQGDSATVLLPLASTTRRRSVRPTARQRCCPPRTWSSTWRTTSASRRSW